jgi:hypothetical protein
MGWEPERSENVEPGGELLLPGGCALHGGVVVLPLIAASAGAPN